MKIAFQTLACPNWPWEKIVSEAARLGYDGIEIRGIEGEMFLPNARPFLPEQIEHTKSLLAEHNLEICCLDSGCAFHTAEAASAAMQEGKATIDLAERLGVPYIRVFGDEIPKGSQEEEVLTRVAAGLEELGRYAEAKGVKVLLETHGDFNTYSRIENVLKRTSSPAIGLLWDFEHPYMHGESPHDTYEHLAPYIFHTHVKDAKRVNQTKVLTLIGEGEVPVKDIVKLLQAGGYQGWLSLELEKKWCDYLPEPEVSLPAYIQYIKGALEV
jgi:sugar phosphate isomerase/epimerase